MLAKKSASLVRLTKKENTISLFNFEIISKLLLRSDDLGRNGRLDRIDETLFAKVVHVERKIVLNVLAGFLAGQSIATNDGRWMNFGLDQLIGILQQFGSDDHLNTSVRLMITQNENVCTLCTYNRGGSISDFIILQLGQIDQHLGSRMFDLQQTQDGRAIVGDCHISDVIDQHLVQSDRTEAGLDYIGDGRTGHYWERRRGRKR